VSDVIEDGEITAACTTSTEREQCTGVNPTEHVVKAAIKWRKANRPTGKQLKWIAIDFCKPLIFTSADLRRRRAACLDKGSYWTAAWQIGR